MKDRNDAVMIPIDNVSHRFRAVGLVTILLEVGVSRVHIYSRYTQEQGGGGELCIRELHPRKVNIISLTVLGIF